MIQFLLQIIYIGLGGFIGAVSRFLISRFIGNHFSAFPLGTLIVNVSGSFLLGFIIYSVSFGKNISPEFRDFMTIGFIGAFTTMSTFAYESFRLAELSEFMYFFFNLFLNIFLCLLAVYLGKELAILLNK
ncbi:MAG TPA: fluoride efflux transporter CrcB [Ignavibacteria bacterium]|nr:fluoride efflux transporter CrcB [Ignavibacteria bacterium]